MIKTENRTQYFLYFILVFFVVVSSFPPRSNGTNPISRLAAMTAFKEYGNFQLDPLQKSSDPKIPEWTLDYSQTPDGHQYSNKAPGSILLGLPFFYVLDSILNSAPTEVERNHRRTQNLKLMDLLMSFFTQVLPWAFLILWLIRDPAESRHSSAGAKIFLVLVLLFGNTTSLFMKTYFGHAHSALWSLGTLIGLERRAWVLASFCLGMAILSEYACVLLIIPFLVFVTTDIFKNHGINGLKRISNVFLGALVPGVLWIVYHVWCFGSPLKIANHFQNPIYIDKANYAIGGLFSSLPSLEIVSELLWGPRRGLLFTNPWVFCVMGLSLGLYFKKQLSDQNKKILLYTLISFLLFFAMNASFNGWHGGSSPGPRYLTPVIVLMAWGAFRIFDQLKSVWKKVLFISLIPSLIFYFAVTTSTLMVSPTANLWKAYFKIF
jgi:hypothetical protein